MFVVREHISGGPRIDRTRVTQKPASVAEQTWSTNLRIKQIVRRQVFGGCIEYVAQKEPRAKEIFYGANSLVEVEDPITWPRGVELTISNRTIIDGDSH